MLTPPGSITPLISGSDLSIAANGSTDIQKRAADIGQPCLTDLSKGKASVSSPLHFTLLTAEPYSNRIQSTIRWPNPKVGCIPRHTSHKLCVFITPAKTPFDTSERKPPLLHNFGSSSSDILQRYLATRVFPLCGSFTHTRDSWEHYLFIFYPPGRHWLPPDRFPVESHSQQHMQGLLH
ncbi:hypothetical protein DPEC_G00126840 [Dallia pectoralis]|uniref:Uncharacterized protein n=1 Tax=Dallia pectoralis TaxID=75939 RepID=A0ACC2GS90_DALPE|nr:hypothetical protein DPEC_G00126840 [Dallia pectoralis]